MYTPVKTIIKNKGLARYAFNAVGISFAIAKGEELEVNGDIFTYMSHDNDAENLLNNINHGLLEVSYAVNSRFPVSSGIDVNMAQATTRQKKLLDKMIGAAPATKATKAKKAAEPKQEEQQIEEKPISIVPADDASKENAKGLTTEGPKEVIPEDAAYKGMFVETPEADVKAVNDPGIGESVVIVEEMPKGIDNKELNVKIEETPIEKVAPKATRNKVK